MSRSLIVLPDDSAGPILEAIAGAKRSLRIKMFAFSDPDVIKAVIEAKKRGVVARVILNAARRDGKRDNEDTHRAFGRAGVDVRTGSPRVELTHEKSMVVDEATAFVMSLNWATKNFTETRDYAVVTNKRKDVREIVEGFDADWHEQHFAPRKGGHLIWCPGPGRDRICQVIDDARHRLWLQNERFQDTVVIERLGRAARRGVKVEVMVRAPHTLKKDKIVEGVGGLRIMDDFGIKIRRLRGLKLHGKALLADGVSAIVGSINLATGSLDGRRELAIEVRDDEVVNRLSETMSLDWEHGRPLDLSDEGLLADLEDRVEDGGHLLSLEGHHDSDDD